ncbi:MAG: hypothetical protein AAGI37_15400 [Planctomycetota bacterium]
MKYLAAALCTLMMIATSFPAQARYIDGMNTYAAYHVMHGGVDPMGTRLVYVEVGNKDLSAVDGIDQYSTPPNYARWLEGQNRLIDQFIVVLDRLTDKQFDDAQVTWAGQEFNGGKQEYIERLEREKTSTIVVQKFGDIASATEKLIELAGDDVHDYDHILLAAHGRAESNDEDGDGVPDSVIWLDEINANGSIVGQTEALEQISESLEGLGANVTIVSCGQRGFFEQIFFGPVERPFGSEVVDDKQIFIIGFQPINPMVIYRRTENSEPLSPDEIDQE